MSLKIMSTYLAQNTSKINSILNNKNNVDRKEIFDELMIIVKECQTRYGGKRELATETDLRILKLCDCWENALSHGLKSSSSVLQNVADLVSGHSISDMPVFWEFAYSHLTAHEKDRFTKLRHVWTDRGKGRSLIRAALNEQSLERYVLIWLSDPNLDASYESWALMKDPEITHLLSTMAAGLAAILFAITIDTPDLNTPSRLNEMWPEPVISAPVPIKNTSTKKTAIVKRKIISLDDNNLSPSSLPSLESRVAASQFSPPSTSSYLSNQICDESARDVNSNNIEENYNSDELVQPESPASIHSISFDMDPPQMPPIPNSSPDAESLNPSAAENISVQSKSTTSLLGSTGSECSDTPDTEYFKTKLQEVTERCIMLENRVAELSLENTRLRNLNSSKNTINYFIISIPRVFLQKFRSKQFYSYEIHIKPANAVNEEWSVSRRYSEFYRLHSKFQKDNFAVKALDFPPKKKFGNMEAHFVEERRQRLQIYLRHLIAILPDVSICTTRSELEKVFPFFKLYE